MVRFIAQCEPEIPLHDKNELLTLMLVSYGLVGLLWLNSNHERMDVIVFRNRAEGPIGVVSRALDKGLGT